MSVITVDITKPELTVMEAALYLGHTGTERIGDLIRKQRLIKGSLPRTVTTESVIAYDNERSRKGTAEGGAPVWYCIHLTDEAAVALAKCMSVTTWHSNPTVSEIMGYLTSGGDTEFVRRYEYNAERAHKSALHNAIEELQREVHESIGGKK